MNRLLRFSILLIFTSWAQLTHSAEDVDLEIGSGSLLLNLGSEAARYVEVFYYRPTSFNPSSKVVLVIPGSGRNADDYRDSWIESADKYDLLVVSPAYPESEYDLAAYQLGGLITNLELIDPSIEMIDGRPYKYRMEDENIKFSYVSNADEYLFEDFDKIFAQVKELTGTTEEKYDLFGHSAGGQLLHRYAIFKPSSNADRIVAGNAGFYTLPNHSESFPFGLEGTDASNEQLQQSFSTKLILLLGEEDNQQETGGIMLHTPKADQQGLGRFERGNYFFEHSRTAALAREFEFSWTLEIVEGVGHNYRAMGAAAAELLYSE